MKKSLYIPFAFLCLLSAMSCIEEKLDPCPPQGGEVTVALRVEKFQARPPYRPSDFEQEFGKRIHSLDYLLYADGDGTLHYFYPEGSVYKDEDGLGLSITKSGNNYTLRDKKDNISYFSNGVLSYRQDANGNRVSCVVNGSGQITALTRQNSGHSLETLASLSYNGSGYLTTIQDQAGRVTGFGYDGAGRLVSVTHPDGSSVSYGYNSGAKLLYARDNESGYAMHYEYSGSTGKISRFYERSGESQGAAVTVGGGYNGIQSYRHCGPDRVSGNSDDIISHYVLDYFGRSTSSYTCLLYTSPSPRDTR